jgi:hypothetical protein
MEQTLKLPNSADVIYCSNPMALDVAIKVKEITKKPLVVQFLDVPQALFGSEDWRLKKYEQVKIQAGAADYITAISKTVAKDVETWLERKVDSVNLLGVDSDVYDAFQPSAGEYVCGVVRGLATQKRYEDIVQAVQASKTKPTLLLIHGGHSDAAKAKIMSKCSLGLGMSSLEGFGLYVAEFAYHQKPFIGRRLPVFEEIWGDSLVYVETPEEMSEKIDWLLNDEVQRKRLGSELLKIIREKKLFLSEHAKRLETTLCTLATSSG